MLVVDEPDFHSFLGSVEYLHRSDEEGVKEILACRFLRCKEGDGCSLEVRVDEGVKEALDCCFVGCKESESPSLLTGDEAANGLKEACHFVGCGERYGPSLAMGDDESVKEALAGCFVESGVSSTCNVR